MTDPVVAPAWLAEHLHDPGALDSGVRVVEDRKSTRLNSSH